MACELGCSNSTTGGDIGSFSVAGHKYPEGSPGSGTLDVGGGCSEQKAMEAGGAVTLVKADDKCRKVQGLPIIIGDTAMSIDAGFSRTNQNFHVKGGQIAITSNFVMNAPVG